MPFFLTSIQTVRHCIILHYRERPAPVTRTFAASQGCTLTRASTILKFSSPYNKHFAAQASSVKMVAYWPSSCFFVFTDLLLGQQHFYTGSDNVFMYLLFGYWTTFEKSVIIT